MQGIERGVGLRTKPQVKKGTWEVIITDPSLNKFTFGPSLISRYVMTDVISPHGQNPFYTTPYRHPLTKN